MTSLSDSQNIDLNQPSGDDHPQLPPSSPLQACPYCDALIDITEREPLELITCPDCAQQFAVTGQVGPYQIVDVAGKGGMGVVYRAYDAGLDRHIALKLLRKDRSDDTEIIKQFETEAEATAALNDPNVVCIYGTGRDRGRFYLAMELVDKGSLDDLINLQVRLPEAQVLRVGIQIASGLKAAWQRGMIHRDVKPGNILFADAHTAKIVDFGLAILMENEESVRGEIWGTPHYVAPEKLDQAPEDFRSDMYSLGASLFHALTGRPPFEGANTDMVVLKHLKSQVVSLQAFAPWVSNPTAHIINRTLAKSPRARFQSYDELIQNLEYALQQLTDQGATPPSSGRVVLETEEDRKSWTWVVLAMVAAMIILLGIVIFMRPKGGKETAGGKSASGIALAKSGVGVASLEEPLRALTTRDAKAAELFGAALASGTVSDQDGAWVAMLEGAAFLSSNQPTEARAAFRKASELAESIRDEHVRKFIRDTSGRLGKPALVTISETVSLDRNSHEAFALFVYGLHNWAAGNLDDGANFLRQFRATQPNSTFPWFNTVKPLVTSMVEELTIVSRLGERLKSASTPAERADIVLEARSLPKALAATFESTLAPFVKETADYLAAANTPPTDGVYQIVNKRSRMGMDVDSHSRSEGALLNQYHTQRHPNQTWALAKQSDGSFTLRALVGENLLDVEKSNKDDGGKVNMWKANGTDAQRWLIELHGDGYFKIRSKSSNLLLTTKDMSAELGAKLDQRSDQNDPSQLWRFMREGDSLNEAWSSFDLGENEGVNRSSFSNGTFTLTNQGKDLWGKKDDATFVAASGSGDFELVARLVSVSGAESPKAGLMVRSSLHPDQNNIAVVYTRDRVVLQRRQNGPSSNIVDTSVNAPGGDDTTVIEGAERAVAVRPIQTPADGVPIAVADADFEGSAAGDGPGSFAYSPVGGRWTYAPKALHKGSGVASNRSAFTVTNPNAPSGDQVAFVQSTGWLSQQVESKTAGTWFVTVSSALRGEYNKGLQTVRVLLDGKEIGILAPTATNYSPFTFRTPSIVPVGSHTLRFEGLSNVDGTVLIDDVRIVSSRSVEPVAAAANAAELVWLKIERRGGKVTTYQSANGKDWAEVGTTETGFVPIIYAGFVLSSRNTEKPATAKFDSVSFVQR